MRVLTRTRSPLATPMRAASRGWSHSGFVWLISCSHLAFPERVWIRVGRRKVGRSTISPALVSSARQWTWLGT
jgi:hypothetical protein